MSDKPGDETRVLFNDSKEAELQLLAAKAKLKPITVKEAEPFPNGHLDFELEDSILKNSKGWQIREALLYSYHWGFPTMTAEDFVHFKQEIRITEVLADPDTVLYVKQNEARAYLGT